MSHEIIVIAEGSHLVGRLPADAEAILDLEGGTYRAVLTEPAGRSLSQLRLWFAVCQIISDNFDGYILSKDQVDQILRIECGHVVVWKDAAGSYRRSPRSIAFNKLSQDEFTALLDRMLAKAGELFGAGLAEAARAELDRIAAPDLKAA